MGFVLLTAYTGMVGAPHPKMMLDVVSIVVGLTKMR
jgi:hypothetical protein